VIQHLSGDGGALQAVIERYGTRRVPYAGPFNVSCINNLRAHSATGEILVFLNDDVTPRGVATLAERQRLVRPL
jgi:hypothetical protein